MPPVKEHPACALDLHQYKLLSWILQKHHMLEFTGGERESPCYFYVIQVLINKPQVWTGIVLIREHSNIT